MLDKNDIALLKDMFAETNARIDKRFSEMDERFLAIDRRFAEMDKRFSEMDERFSASDAKFDSLRAEMDRRFSESNDRMDRLYEKLDAKFNDQLIRSESFLLDEIERLQKNIDKKLSAINESISELKQYYQITKLENDTITILIRTIDQLQDNIHDLQKRIGGLEQKIQNIA